MAKKIYLFLARRLKNLFSNFFKNIFCEKIFKKIFKNLFFFFFYKLFFFFWKKFCQNKNTVVPPCFFFSWFFAFFALIWLNCKTQNAKNGIFCHFFAFFLKTYSAYTPVFFAVKGGSHPGKNPPIYTVLNAAFSCAKTSVEGHSARLVHDPAERQIFFSEKNFLLSSREFLSS